MANIPVNVGSVSAATVNTYNGWKPIPTDLLTGVVMTPPYVIINIGAAIISKGRNVPAPDTTLTVK